MQFRPPKSDGKYSWTNHVQQKMIYYGISESLIKRIIRFPKRKEEGIAPGTVAVMQPGSNKKKPTEIWVMYQDIKSEARNSKFETNYNFQIPKRRIISAWRYPGISPIGKKLHIPDDVMMDLEAAMNE